MNEIRDRNADNVIIYDNLDAQDYVYQVLRLVTVFTYLKNTCKTC